MSPRSSFRPVRRPLLAALLCLAASTRGLAQAGDETPAVQLHEASPLQEYFLVAAQQNPRLQRLFEEWVATLHAIAVARGWPDPTLSYTTFLSSVETALGPQRAGISLMQPIPWFGKLSLRGDASEQAAHAARQRFERERLELYTRVARAYYEYAYLARATQVTHENLELMRFQEAVARSRYTTDSTRYAELIKAQVELGVLEDQLATLRDQRSSRAASLNVALGQAAQSPLPWPVQLVDPGVSIPDDATVRSTALAANPAVREAEREADRRASLADLARRDRYPDLMLGVGTVLIDESELTSFDELGRDAWTATLSFRLPLWQGKYRGAIRQADAVARAAEHRVEDSRRDVDARVDELLFGLRDAGRKIALYRDSLVPKAEQALRAADTAYRAEQASFLDYLDAERTLLRFQLDLARALANWGQRSVETAALMGGDPFDASMLSTHDGLEGEKP